jgi:hypothetical protein
VHPTRPPLTGPMTRAPLTGPMTRAPLTGPMIVVLGANGWGPAVIVGILHRAMAAGEPRPGNARLLA